MELTLYLQNRSIVIPCVVSSNEDRLNLGSLSGIMASSVARRDYATVLRFAAQHHGIEIMLYIFGGLPGAGKSALSLRLAQKLNALYLRIDTIEQAMRDSGIADVGPAGYIVGYSIAADNLRLGLDVVADSVNPLRITRDAWREMAQDTKVRFVEIEVVCSSEEEHRSRVESRSTDILGLKVPTWAEVLNRKYDPWDGEHIVVDTAGRTLEQSLAALDRALQLS